jgi:hypothetical protein
MKDGLVKQVKQQVDKAKDKVRDLRSEGIEMVWFFIFDNFRLKNSRSSLRRISL